MNKPLHIVCLDAPAPPDYGGAIEMYYKIKALAELGAAITLHYFDYKQGRHADDLKSYCEKIISYERKSFLQAPTFSKPHIVASRINKQLIERLNADNDPILLEGVHCTGIIPYLKNKSRSIVVRLHNDEAVYYRNLAKAESNFFKSAYYTTESWLLVRYQKRLSTAASYAALSQNDAERFRNDYGLKEVFLIPAFVPWQDVTSLTGSGSYCLYHGNLAVAENEAAVLWLIHYVFSKTEILLVVAGQNISDRLRRAASLPKVLFLSNPTEEQLKDLIQKAHIHVLPDLNNTGVKLKLLHALFCGRFCLTNNMAFSSSNTVAIAHTPEQYMGFLKSFQEQSFTEADREERKKILRLYNNHANAETLIAHLC